MTDLSQRLGPQRIAVTHLVLQVVATFGQRRVIVGACVLAMNDALNETGAMRNFELKNCGVQGGGVLSVVASLRDSGARAHLLGSRGGSGDRQKSFDRARRGTQNKKPDVTTAFAGKWSASRNKLKLLTAMNKGGLALLKDRSDSQQTDASASEVGESTAGSRLNSFNSRIDDAAVGGGGGSAEPTPSSLPSLREIEQEIEREERSEVSEGARPSESNDTVTELEMLPPSARSSAKKNSAKGDAMSVKRPSSAMSVGSERPSWAPEENVERRSAVYSTSV